MFQNTACLVHAAGKHGLVLFLSGTSRSNNYVPSRYDKLIYLNELCCVIKIALTAIFKIVNAVILR